MAGRAQAARWLVLAACVAFAIGCSPSASSTAPASESAATGTTSSASTAPSATRSPAASPTATPAPSVDVAAARAAFAYSSAVPTFEEVSTATEGAATIRDVTYETVDGRSVSAFLVTPSGDGPFPVVVFLHWLASNEPTGDRTEFLDEAIVLAGRGVVSLLPQQVFPWKQPPTGAAEDRQAVIDQVVDVRIGLDALLALPDVDPERVAVVGHDFGGMYATLVAGLDDRVDALVAAAGVPHFADWYLRYWRPVPASGEAAYRATMLEVDPVTFLPAFGGSVLLQFSKTDRYVNQGAIDAWTAASPSTTTSVKTYAWNHSLHTESAQADRDAFLASALGLEP